MHKSKTPIVDFLEKYSKSGISRFHMPGHKGHVFFGWEPFDITEITGADVLHHGDGIIRESEKNAAALFGSGATYYSTEGSTLCIKAMLAALKMEHGNGKERPYILAARNVHRSMIDACALLDLDVCFLQEKESRSICTSVLLPQDLEAALQQQEQLPLGIYITSPDYLGQMADIEALSEIADRWEIPLLTDNAHGAYLHFLEEKKHPLDLGAAMCCDSAHKTLPALTGTAYLHVHKKYKKRFEPYINQALMLFGSTSPSYLLMQSLDSLNAYLSDNYSQKLAERICEIVRVKERLKSKGILVKNAEPLKIVIDTAANGYTGEEIAGEMRSFLMECEYADRQNVVLMITPENTKEDLERILIWADSTKLLKKRKKELEIKELGEFRTERALSIREAVFAKSEFVPSVEAVGRICAAETISCPPAVPIAVSGERITQKMAEAFLQFGIQEVCVVCVVKE